MTNDNSAISSSNSSSFCLAPVAAVETGSTDDDSDKIMCTTQTVASVCKSNEMPNSNDTHENSQSDLNRQIKNAREQLDALLESVNLVSALAYMNSEAYQQRSQQEIKLLNELENRWKLEDTPLPNLISSINRLQSNVIHLQGENKQDLEEIRTLHKRIALCESENKKYKKVTKELLNKNKKLKQRLEKEEHENKALVKSVKKYIKKKREEDLDKEQLHVATQSLVHESMLKLKQKEEQLNASIEKYNNNNRYYDSNESTNFAIRSRSNTHESTISELDCDGSYDFDYGISTGHEDVDSIQTDCMEALIDCNSSSISCVESDSAKQNPSNNRIDDCCSANDSSSVISTCSTSSRSFVTDYNIATLRLNDSSASYLPCLNENTDEVNTTTPTSSASVGSGATSLRMNSYKKTAIIYTMTFPVGTQVGLQFKAFNVQPNDTVTNEGGYNGHDTSVHSNRNRSFSDGVTILDNKNTKNPNPKPSETLDYQPKPKSAPNFFDSFISSLTPQEKKKDSHQSLLPKQKNIKHHQTTAILVCDLNGFDTSINVRPTVGARLIAIDNQSLLDTKKWTVDKVNEILNRKSSVFCSSSSDETDTSIAKTFTLTFRNDSLTKEQKDELFREEENYINDDGDKKDESFDDATKANKSKLDNVATPCKEEEKIPHHTGLDKFFEKFKPADSSKKEKSKPFFYLNMSLSENIKKQESGTTVTSKKKKQAPFFNSLKFDMKGSKEDKDTTIKESQKGNDIVAEPSSSLDSKKKLQSKL